MDDPITVLETLVLKAARAPRYALVPAAGGRPASIVCLDCGAESFHPEDVRLKYCGRCHRFHEDPRP